MYLIFLFILVALFQYYLLKLNLLLKILLLALCYSPLLWRGAGGEALAQHPEAKRATHWYFGNGAGLDFSSGSPVAVTGAIFTVEGCATISDKFGNLQFYTDGSNVWDRTHNLMPNGTGLFGCESSTQAALIVPNLVDTSIYYIFTTDCDENQGLSGANYSIVDMSLNSGLGDVSSKNNFLFYPTTEKLTATKCDDKIWILFHKYNTNEFYAYKVDSSGLNINPVISSIGSIHTEFWGGMKFSPDGKMLATTLNDINNKNELFQFDINTGILSNPLSLDAYGGEYSLSFSPDNSKLYFTANGNTIYQYDVSTYNQNSINFSRVIVATSFDNSDMFGIQSAIDSFIYVTGTSRDSLHFFSSPNSTGIASNFLKNQIFLINNSQAFLQLPNFIENYFNYSVVTCVNDENTVEDTSTLVENEFIPNIFTPNNDGINDVFSIEINGYETIAWKIYNRWGSELKTGDLKIENDGTIALWDGRTTSGTKARDGTYYYIIQLTTKESKIETKKGFITLLN